jgi:hypothetical protein
MCESSAKSGLLSHSFDFITYAVGGNFGPTESKRKPSSYSPIKTMIGAEILNNKGPLLLNYAISMGG